MPNNLINFTDLDDIEIYELVLQGRIPNFPSGFWVNRSEEEAKHVAIKLLKYLIDERLKFNKKDVKTEVSKMFLTKYKLHTASKLFGRSAIRYIINAYPEAGYLPWQFKHDKVPQSYWTDEQNRVNALKYIFEVEMKWGIEDVKEKLTWGVFEENGLGSLHYYYPSLFRIIKAVYKNEISPWEIANSEVPNGTWESESNRISAVKWLILRTKLQNEQINRKTFAKYGLSRLLGKYFGDNAARAISEAIDGE
ncbi:DUF4046 domain-containing protein [Clostridium estertheticum]|uniref:DUF4046 domain-containing protein n=1 Tax=Clostridium estertheticum TaxID=238834 RepID=UPI001CF4B248|nr:DUF4046 domain-containing protein [Clostridium estertheticum]MCB2305611.1 DUF4046 domain-containing protein [Clostridium estertheticum]MCB2344573.1 DUF4046 domain-containing protein [Clostridium estertheticum]MCB2347967.1 DUF4046 domain-containing protein [Clostridium estertheticum]WAG45611.1 DUF4046 domain-containing protein [Clostridium estertheticum]